MKSWLNIQIEWLKSFFSEQKNVGAGTVLKGSSRRISTYVLVYVFAYTYINLEKIPGKIPDIPTTWAVFLAFIIGLNLFTPIAKDVLLKKKDEVQNEQK